MPAAQEASSRHALGQLVQGIAHRCRQDILSITTPIHGDRVVTGSAEGRWMAMIHLFGTGTAIRGQ